MAYALIFNFHGLGDIPAHVGEDERPYWIGEREFAVAIDKIADLGTHGPVHITFDDGNLSDLSIAASLLKSRGLAATFFICTGRIGKPGYLDADGLKNLVATGFSVGSHGVDHLDWHSLPDEVLTTEIHRSQATLSSILGMQITDFAAPFGGYDKRVLAEVRRAGGTRLYTSDGVAAELGKFLLPRFTQTASSLIGIQGLRHQRPPLGRAARIALKSLRGGPA